MPKFIDNAAPVLHGEPTINDSQRESLWDLFHRSANTTELAAKLQPMDLHPGFKRDLLNAKNKPAVEYDQTEKIINAMMALPPETLELAEKHPHVLAHVTKAANTEE